jgi:hypothetical protein
VHNAHVRRIRRSLFAALAFALIAVALPGAPASAAPREGWVRLAHMSPDTGAVNITLSSLSGDVTLFRLQNIAYGMVSNYMRLPQGTYALAMVPVGNNTPNTPPVISGAVQVKAGTAETLAAIGKNAAIKTTLFTDDLNALKGRARVRIVQVSVAHSTVDATAGSTTVAKGATFGEVSKYATVQAGRTSIDLKSGSDALSLSLSFAAGTSHTLFVIDNAKGGLAVSPALDSAAATVTPVGSLAAGGGGLAAGDTGLALLLAAVAAAGGFGAFGVMSRRRSEVRAS